MSLPKTALFDILHGSKHICSLCLKKIDDEFYNLQDEVIFDINISQKLSEVLSFLLSSEYVENMEDLNTVCKECTNTAIASFNFVKMCQYNAQQLHIAVDSLDNYLETTNSVADCYATLVIDFDMENYNVDLYGDTSRYDFSIDSTELLESFKKAKYLANMPLHKKNRSNNSKPVKSLNVNVETNSGYLVVSSELIEKKRRKKTKFGKYFDNIQYTETCTKNNFKFKCKFCDKTDSKLTVLKMHYLIYHAPKNLQCSKCSEKFSCTSLLKRHEKKKHNNFMCSQCAKEFTNKYILKKHELSHRTHLSCPTCKKEFNTRKQYEKHTEEQTCLTSPMTIKKRKYECDECGKKYLNKSNLTVHIKVFHMNKNAHICEWCGKKFIAASMLRSHIIKHTKEKNFCCIICGGTFVTKESLLYHTRIHTGETPYECPRCDRKFLSASRRADHIRRHHLNEMTECDVCHIALKKVNLGKHKRKFCKGQPRCGA